MLTKYAAHAHKFAVSCLNYLYSTWQGMCLSTKLMKIAEKYKISRVVNGYAILLSIVSLAGFIGLLIYALKDCSTTQYMSFTKKVSKSGSNSETSCQDVPTSISDYHYIAGSGYWSTETYYLAKDTMFKTTFADFSATEVQFSDYMDEFQVSLLELNDILKVLPYSRAIKKIITYRNGSWEDPMNTIPYFDVNTIFKPESASMSYNTHCGDSFSPLHEQYLSLGSSGYSYDRSFFVQGKTTSDGPIMTFSLTVSPTTSAYDVKVELDGSSTTSAFSESDASEIADVDDLYSMPGFVDDYQTKLGEEMCPPGFTAALTSDGLVCSLSFDMNVFATVAALNSGYGDPGEILAPDGDYRYTTRNYISDQVIASKEGMYYLSIDGYLFIPEFNHYFAEDCESGTCNHDEVCSTNDFDLSLTPSGYFFNETSTSDVEDDIFTIDMFLTQCSLFAPLYPGPNTNYDTEECTYDETYSCYNDWIGDGYCDDANNNDCCEWDGGDCCDATCESTTFSCGDAGYYCCETSGACSAACSITAENCDDFQSVSSYQAMFGERPKTVNKIESARIMHQKAKINSAARKLSLEKRNLLQQSITGKTRATIESRGLQELKRMRQGSKKEKIDFSHYNSFEIQNSHDWKNIRSSLGDNLPIIDAARKFRSNDTGDRVRKGQLQPRLNSGEAEISATRRLAVIPEEYSIDSIADGQLYSASLTNFDSTQTGFEQYGYITLETPTASFSTETNYLCYSKAATEAVHLCSVLCNRKFSDTLSPYNDDDSTYGGFIASTQTMAHAFDIGSLIEAAVADKGFIMSTAITFDEAETENHQDIYVMGSRATKSTEVPTEVDDTFSNGIENSDSLPCEVAACYCYDRETEGVEFSMNINTISSNNFINPFYFSMTNDETANCANPFKSFVIPGSAPVDLLESYYTCKTIICPDLIGAVGSVLANVTSAVSIVAIVFSFLITDFYLPKVKKVSIEDWRKDDGAYEEAVLDIIEETLKSKGEAIEMTSLTTDAESTMQISNSAKVVPIDEEEAKI